MCGAPAQGRAQRANPGRIARDDIGPLQPERELVEEGRVHEGG